MTPTLNTAPDSHVSAQTHPATQQLTQLATQQPTQQQPAATLQQLQAVLPDVHRPRRANLYPVFVRVWCRHNPRAANGVSLASSIRALLKAQHAEEMDAYMQRIRVAYWAVRDIVEYVPFFIPQCGLSPGCRNTVRE